MMDIMQMKICQVGLFKMPGLKFTKDQLTDSLLAEMVQWSKENTCGIYMSDQLWSFRNEKQRDWFILRWTDSLAREIP